MAVENKNLNVVVLILAIANFYVHLEKTVIFHTPAIKIINYR